MSDLAQSTSEPASEAEPAARNPSDTGTPEEPRRRRRPVAIALLALGSLATAFLLYQALTWPDVAALARTHPETTAFMERYAERRRAAGEAARPAHRWVPYGRISPHLKRAVLVAEDIDFFSHHGFAWNELKNAVREAWEEREPPRGASTLTQQLAKNLWLTPSRNPWRKVKEALLTRQLERHLSKHRILELYLNVVEFGPGIYGAEAAARHYFGKSAADLTPHESAALAAALPRPSRWHPGSPSRAYHNRVTTIERRMEKARFLWKEI